MGIRAWNQDFDVVSHGNQPWISVKPAGYWVQNCFGLLSPWALCMGPPEPEVGQAGLARAVEGTGRVPACKQVFRVAVVLLSLGNLRREASPKVRTGAVVEAVTR